MSKISKTDKLKTEIFKKIEKHISNNVLLNDIEKFLKELNWWKISTLNKNIESFLLYIDDISKKYEVFDEDLEEENEEIEEHFKICSFNNNLKKFNKKHLKNINQVRGFFLLTVTEFTQGRNSNLVLQYRKIIDKIRK